MISQSGAIIEEAIDASHACNIPLGAVVSVGNSMHLGIIEYLDELGRDERCRAILLYVESFGDAARFGEVARAVVKMQAGDRADRRTHGRGSRCCISPYRITAGR